MRLLPRAAGEVAREARRRGGGRHVNGVGVGVGSKGDIDAGLTQDRSVDNFIRVR
jgi:hypothetical protein